MRSGGSDLLLDLDEVGTADDADHHLFAQRAKQRSHLGSDGLRR